MHHHLLLVESPAVSIYNLIKIQNINQTPTSIILYRTLLNILHVNQIFMLMMLLIVTASLVGISSSIYKPASVETQPQSPAQPPPAQKQAQNNIVTQQMGQVIEDKVLVDRLFPYIIQKIDGKTLLQKLDGKLLAQKVFPYLDLKVNVVEREGQRGQVKASIPGLGTSKFLYLKAPCAPDETVISGGFSGSPGEITLSIRDRKNNEDQTYSPSNGWQVSGYVDEGHFLSSFAYCLKAELVLKQEQQPQQPSSSPSQPPGGPPLRPPPEFGK
jgi:hypothetical protein